MRWLPPRGEADELREQAASRRRLARTSQSASGSIAPRPAAHRFGLHAARVDPLPVPAIGDGIANGDSAALVRVRLALEWQVRNRFGFDHRDGR